MNSSDFHGYGVGIEALCAGLLKLVNASTAGYRDTNNKYVFLCSDNTRAVVDDCVRAVAKVLYDICDGFTVENNGG